MARLLWRFAALLAGICCLTLVGGTYLVQATLRTAQDETFQARFALLAQRAAGAAENAQALGIALSAGSPVAALLEREAALEPALLSFDIVGAQGQTLLQTRRRPGRRRPFATIWVKAWPRCDCTTTKRCWTLHVSSCSAACGRPCCQPCCG